MIFLHLTMVHEINSLSDKDILTSVECILACMNLS